MNVIGKILVAIGSVEEVEVSGALVAYRQHVGILAHVEAGQVGQVGLGVGSIGRLNEHGGISAPYANEAVVVKPEATVVGRGVGKAVAGVEGADAQVAGFAAQCRGNGSQVGHHHLRCIVGCGLLLHVHGGLAHLGVALQAGALLHLGNLEVDAQAESLVAIDEVEVGEERLATLHLAGELADAELQHVGLGGVANFSKIEVATFAVAGAGALASGFLAAHADVGVPEARFRSGGEGIGQRVLLIHRFHVVAGGVDHLRHGFLEERCVGQAQLFHHIVELQLVDVGIVAGARQLLSVEGLLYHHVLVGLLERLNLGEHQGLEELDGDVEGGFLVVVLQHELGVEHVRGSALAGELANVDGEGAGRGIPSQGVVPAQAGVSLVVPSLRQAFGVHPETALRALGVVGAEAVGHGEVEQVVGARCPGIEGRSQRSGIGAHLGGHLGETELNGSRVIVVGYPLFVSARELSVGRQSKQASCCKKQVTE